MKLFPDDPKKKNAVFLAAAFLVGLYAFHSFWYTGHKEQIDEMSARYDPHTLKDGWNIGSDGERFYYISNPALGLWAAKSRLK